jgi:hypothetical protein
VSSDEPAPDGGVTAFGGRSQGILLLLTVLLVLAGLILLVLGFVNNSMRVLYASIACAAVAGVTLIVFSRRGRRRAVRGAVDPAPDLQSPPGPDGPRPAVAGDDRPAGYPEAD